MNVGQSYTFLITFKSGMVIHYIGLFFNFTACGKHLAQNGYGIAESSPEFLTFTTAAHNTTKFNYEYIINFVVLGNGVIKLTMKWRLKKSVVG